MILFHWRVKSLGLARQFRLEANQILSFSRMNSLEIKSCNCITSLLFRSFANVHLDEEIVLASGFIRAFKNRVSPLIGNGMNLKKGNQVRLEGWPILL